jgi:hypothetical protein
MAAKNRVNIPYDIFETGKTLFRVVDQLAGMDSALQPAAPAK